MDDNTKRVIVAVVLSFIVIVGWNFLFPPQQPPTQSNQAANQTQQETPTVAEDSSSQVPGASQTGDGVVAGRAQQSLSGSTYSPEGSGKRVTVETPLYKATINAAGGVLEHLVLKQYQEAINPGAKNVDLITRGTVQKAPMGLIWQQRPTWSEADWELQGNDLQLGQGESGSLTLVGTIDGVRLERTLHFSAETYLIDETLNVANARDHSLTGTVSFTMASEQLAEESRYNRTELIYFNGGLNKESDTDELQIGIHPAETVSWGGIASNYFLLAAVPTSGNMDLRGKYEDEIYRVALGSQVAVAPEQSAELSCSYYVGPKESEQLAQAPQNLLAAIQYGWFDFIAKPLIKVLKFFYSYVGNYGVAIILLTILIKIVFWPLSQKSYKSMEKMKKLQPMMTQLKEKYGDDRQKLNEEMMRLYKTYKVNPAGGCLPMLLQIPVFIALYQALLGAIELRHAAFITHVPFTDIIWLADLSAKDPLYVTPIVMGATMFLQQKMTPTPGDSTQAKVMMFMPLIFTFIFLSFPAGLVVYWLVNNVLSIAQQWMLTRKAS
ncbi:membrane protein insertase YidC [Desulfohalobium retbaense]|uniref:Membrane protein insertase YidC n=1 Tax=Desulfohalobium retbaense (strain ATCC 49708 / DSM 5692 / JCM 16813 / HR100) TaxID=485915 RepID=C8X4E9_DESRD|nr:membrane protein insertase YidC [Desulfohalobium retbaense]ACV69423.1 membrane protein insertase, YidC/Oxa1 family [Desulfohalobium retbaense DSM 5692]